MTMSTWDSDVAENETSGAHDAVTDPLSDLLFTVVAVLILVLVAILPGSISRMAETAATPLDHLMVQDHDDITSAFLATQDGLIISQNSAQKIATTDLTTSATLIATLDRAARSRARILLIVAPGSSEAAFLFEAQAAAHRVASLTRLRLDRTCRLANRDLRLADCLGALP